MKRRVLLDTGPLVAILNRRDKYHTWSVSQWNQIEPPLLTCEAVLSEACFLLSQFRCNTHPVVDMLNRGALAVPFQLKDHAKSLAKLLDKYRSVPMSLADSCLVQMSEIFPDSSILTVDNDFNIYRKYGRQTIPAIMPTGL